MFDSEMVERDREWDGGILVSKEAVNTQLKRRHSVDRDVPGSVCTDWILISPDVTRSDNYFRRHLHANH